MKVENLRDFLTGLTAIVGLAGLAMLLLLFGELSRFTARTYDFRLQVPSAVGLKDTSPVTLNGVKIGRVADLAILPSTRGVELTLRINRGVEVPRAFEPTIESSFVGESALELAVPPTLSPEQLADAVRPGETIQARELSTALARIARSVERPLERFSAAADSIDKLAVTYTTLGERLNELVEPRTSADVAAGKAPNVRTTLARLDSALGSAQAWLDDTALRDDARSLLDKANSLAKDASDLVASWKSAAATVEQATTKVGDQAIATLRDVASSLETVDAAAGEFARLVEGVNKGKGTLGNLATNPDLYLSLKDASQRLDRALAEFQQLIEKVKAEGVKVGL